MFLLSMAIPTLQIAAGFLLQYISARWLVNNGTLLDSFLIGLCSGVLWGNAIAGIGIAIKENRERKEMRRRLAEMRGDYDVKVEPGQSVPAATNVPVYGPDALQPKGSGHVVIKDVE